MKPILYDATETEFESQGLGTLAETISCKITEERNNSYELEMVYPQSGKHFSDIKLSRIVKAIPAYRKDPEPFRIYEISKPLDGKITVKAEHISYQLSYIPVKPFTANSVNVALECLKTNSAEDNPFTFWTSKETAATMSFTEPTSCRALLGGVSGSILDTYTGEYEWCGYTVKLHDHRGEDKGVAIRYGKNLTDIKQEESIANTVTGICPYWKDSETGEVVTLPEVTISSDKAANFPYKLTVVHDFSSSFDEPPTEAQLRLVAQNYIKQTNFGVPEVSVDVSFVLLSQFEGYEDMALLETVNLCDTVTVYFESLGISTKAKVIKTVYNTIDETYDSISLGSEKNTLTTTLEEITAQAAQTTEEKVAEEISARKKAISELEKKVGKGKGLYVTDTSESGAHDWYLHEKPELADSQTVIHINDGGMLFSTDGGKSYNGIDWDGTAILKKIYAIGIEADHVLIDSKSITSYIKTLENTVSTQGTTLEAINGKIEGKVWATDITTALEPVQESVNTAQSTADNAVTVTTQNTNEIESLKTSTEAITTALSSYTKTTEFEEYKKEVSSQLSQTPEAITARFTTLEETISRQGDDSNDKWKQLETYIRFGADGITIGKTDDPLTLTIDNGQICFMQSGQKVAWFTNNKLYVSNVETTTMAMLVGLKITKNGTHIQIS